MAVDETPVWGVNWGSVVGQPLYYSEVDEDVKLETQETEGWGSPV